jgi:glycosyl transferase family 25
MSNNIEKIIYINLDKRQDRREEIEKELKEYNLYEKSERFVAINVEGQGILGCTMSHLEVIKLAKERRYNEVLILEDDYYFIVPKEEFEDELKKFFESKVEYDVCMISYNIIKSEPTDYSFINKIIDAQTASGYIIHNGFYDTLIKVLEDAIEPLRKTNEHWLYANDQIWKNVQPQSKWYSLTTRCGKQRDGYSDNSNKYQTYDC